MMRDAFGREISLGRLSGGRGIMGAIKLTAEQGNALIGSGVALVSALTQPKVVPSVPPSTVATPMPAPSPSVKYKYTPPRATTTSDTSWVGPVLGVTALAACSAVLVAALAIPRAGAAKKKNGRRASRGSRARAKYRANKHVRFSKSSRYRRNGRSRCGCK